jgi:DNA-directed RNA polymerase specialized sigma24 family protein
MSPGFDQAAGFSALYHATHLDLLAFLLRRTPTAEDAPDCLAETYLIAWEKRERIPEGDGARPWLFGVARNVMRRGRERSGRACGAAGDRPRDHHDDLLGRSHTAPGRHGAGDLAERCGDLTGVSAAKALESRDLLAEVGPGVGGAEQLDAGPEGVAG